MRGERSNYDPEKNENQAVLTMQRYVRGILIRRAVKAKYGFEAKQQAFAAQTYT